MKKYKNSSGFLHRLDGPAIEYPDRVKKFAVIKELKK